ncbi:myosin-2 heavy chain, partial [Tanacetum coccineum]
GGTITVTAVGGDNYLGGEDFDMVIVNHYVQEFRKRNFVDNSRGTTNTYGFFDRKPICKNINADKAVAYGAAVLAANLSGEEKIKVCFNIDSNGILSVSAEIKFTEVNKARRPLAPANSLVLAWKQRTGKMVGSDGGEPHFAERVHKLHKMRRTDDMSHIVEENGNKHDFADDVYVKRVDSENNKDSKSDDNPTFQEQATVKKKSKSLNKKVDKQRSSNDWSMGSLSDRIMADILNSPENQ